MLHCNLLLHAGGNCGGHCLCACVYKCSNDCTLWYVSLSTYQKVATILPDTDPTPQRVKTSTPSPAPAVFLSPVFVKTSGFSSQYRAAKHSIMRSIFCASPGRRKLHRNCLQSTLSSTSHNIVEYIESQPHCQVYHKVLLNT